MIFTSYELRVLADRIDREMVELPKDAEGEPIHIGDVLYSSGNECRVISITVKADEACVGVHTDEGAFLPSVNPKYLSRKNTEPLEPEPPDSWEKLLDDLDNAAKGGDNAECLYMRREDIEVGEQCSGCRLYNADDVFSDCSCLAYGNIADRIRKLRGEN